MQIVVAFDGGSSKGSIPRTERTIMNGQRKTRQYRPTKPKKRVMLTRLSW